MSISRDTAYLSTSIAFDCIVLAITLISTAVKNVSQGTRYWNILQTIRWDGTMYFCVILSGNVVWMSLAMNARVCALPHISHPVADAVSSLLLSVWTEVHERTVRLSLPFLYTAQH
jgi:hypothetical protein